MIGWLRGKLLLKSPSRVVIETGGVGYEVNIPFSTLFSLGELGSEVSLWIHTNVREDALQLFGFASERELTIFRRLIGVSGIGPKMAATILSGIPADDLAEAIRGANLRRLSTVPGVGKKTAERLIVELKEKFDDLVSSVPSSVSTRGIDDAVRNDAISALTNLGYRQRDAVAALDQVEVTSGGTLEALLKAALARLAQ